ncbi:MAG: SDR family oxidoreductase [Oscillospiraceae bacterium]|jgi:3-oxoacyl-[acyl-carrier protein] reductase|nr:SDR family oxidoreductase [Oscillospiraceae bacterium]
MRNPSISLDGKKIFITGVSRPRGIGAALARRFAEAGAAIAVHGFSDFDLTVGNRLSSMPDGTKILAKQFNDSGLNVTAVTPSDLEVKGNAEKAVEEAAERLGGLDGMILNHAYGVYAEIGQWTAEHIDSHLLVNVRAAMMMLQSFAGQVDSSKDNAVTLFTSGQYRIIETNLMAYSVSKEATICLCRGAAELLGEKGIRVNCINPGCNDTGYCFGEAYEAIARRHPSGRWGTPDDTADLALFLHSPYAKWITGEVIASHGGCKGEF